MPCLQEWQYTARPIQATKKAPTKKNMPFPYPKRKRAYELRLQRRLHPRHAWCGQRQRSKKAHHLHEKKLSSHSRRRRRTACCGDGDHGEKDRKARSHHSCTSYLLNVPSIENSKPRKIRPIERSRSAQKPFFFKI